MVTVRDILEVVPCEMLSGQSSLDSEVRGGYVSDLLSNVMAQAQPGWIWVTMQGHQNIVAVASLAGLAGVILAGGVRPDPETIEKAEREKVPLLATAWPAFEVAGRLYGCGLRGR